MPHQILAQPSLGPDQHYSWVIAAPFAAHFRRACAESGLPWRVVGYAAGLPTPTARGLLDGTRRRLPRAMARRIMQLSAGSLGALATRSVPGGATGVLLRDLRARDVAWTELAAVLGCSEFEVRVLSRGRGSCTQLQALQVMALAEEAGATFVETSRIAA